MPDGPEHRRRGCRPPLVRIAAQRVQSRARSGRRARRTPPASTSWNGSHPRYGRGQAAPGGGQTKVLRADPRAADRLAQLVQPHLGEHHRRPAPQTLSFRRRYRASPSANRSAVLPISPVCLRRCRPPAARNMICLPRFSAVRYSAMALGRRLPTCGNKQMTASQREVALMSWFFHRSPGRKPVSGSVSRKTSLANGGSCATSQVRKATAWRLSRLA